MSTTQPLDVQVTVTLDGSGAGTAQCGPTLPGTSWQPAQASVSCSQDVSTGACQCNIYAGPAAAQQWFIDGTFSGDTGDTTDAFSAPVWPGQYVFAAWTGGVAGATASLRVTGTRLVP